MSETDLPTRGAEQKLSDKELARSLTLDALAELDAMRLYEAHIEATDNQQAKKLLAYIATDEREHYALFLELIRRLDPDQDKEAEAVRSKLDVILQAPVVGAQERVHGPRSGDRLPGQAGAPTKMRSRPRHS